MLKKLGISHKEGHKGPSSSASVQSTEGDTTPLNLHDDAHDDGGLSCNNDELLRQQQKAILKWMKTMGQRLFSGNVNVLNTPFPVEMFEPRSYLEKLADVWVHPRFLREAAATANPQERMRLTITWFIAGLHHSFEKWKKPFNPILGETWQASLSDGSSISMEQISHHPPVSSFNIEGPGGSYRFVGLSQPHVTIQLKSYGFKTVAKGYRYVEFGDGTRITIDYPSYVMKGVVYSSRPRAGFQGLGKVDCLHFQSVRPTILKVLVSSAMDHHYDKTFQTVSCIEVEGTATFIDSQNCLKAFVRFGSHKTSSSKLMRRSDAIVGEIYDIRGCVECECTADKAVTTTTTTVTVSDGEALTASDDEFESASETDWDMRDDSPDEDKTPTPELERLHMQDTPSGKLEEMPSLSLETTSRSRDGDGGAKSGSSGMFTKMFGLSSMTAAPQAQKQQGTVVSTFEGSWLSHLDFDGKRYWSLKHDAADEWMPARSPLASDCRFRRDLMYLTEGRPTKEIQTAKEELEHLQRADAKLRGVH